MPSTMIPGNRTLGEVFDQELSVGRSGVGPDVIFDDQHKTEFLDGGEVETFVSNAGGLAAVADIGHDGDFAALHARAQGDSAENGNQITQRRYRGDDVLALDVAEVRGGVASFGWRSGLGHVLHHDVGG